MKYFHYTHLFTIIIISFIRIFFSDFKKTLSQNINLFSYSEFKEHDANSLVYFVLMFSILLNYALPAKNIIFKGIYCILILLNISIIIMYLHRF